MIRRSFVTSVVLAAVIAGGCALSTHRIADIQQSPGRYQHRNVTVEGTVISSVGSSFLPVQVYRVSDGTGELTVIANDIRGVPQKGAHVRVRGRVEDVASFGSRSIGLHLRQEHVSVDRGY